MSAYSFSPPFEQRFLELEKKFPKRSSLVLWSLHLVQEDIGYITPEAVDYVAARVGVSPAWVKGVVSFYSMFREKPIGKYHLNVCSNLMCQLMGSDKIEQVIQIDQLLKAAGLCGSGGEAKQRVADGVVFVDGAVETRKRAKLRPGQHVTYGGETVELVAGPAAGSESGAD